MTYLPVVFVWLVSAVLVSVELSQPVSLSVHPHTVTDRSNHTEIYSLLLYLTHSAGSSTQVTHISVYNKTRHQLGNLPSNYKTFPVFTLGRIMGGSPPPSLERSPLILRRRGDSFIKIKKRKY